MILYFLNKTPLKKIYFKKWGPKWVKNKISSVTELLNENDLILDVGSGNGLVAYTLMQLGYDVMLLDIAHQAFDPSVKPVIYDGKQIPFADKKFDVALVLSVLHHTQNPEALLKEVGRVAKRIIINEDIYDNKLQKYLTLFSDALINSGYAPCPRTNKNDQAWKSTFKDLKFRILNVKYMRVLFFFKQAIYHIASE